MFNIASFNAQIARKGLQKPNKFVCRITPPVKLWVNLPVNSFNSPANLQSETTNGLDLSRSLEFWTEGAHVPALMVDTAEHNHYGYGSTEKTPYRAKFSEVTLVLLADGQDDNWTFFKNWQALVINSDMSDGSTTQIKTHGMSAFETSYKSDYVGTVQIHTFDDTGLETKNIMLVDAWPIFLGDKQLNWGENNAFMRIPVSFTFSTWYAGGPTAATRRRQTPISPSGPLGLVTDGQSF